MGRPRERAPALLESLDSDPSDNEGGTGTCSHCFLPQGRLKDTSQSWGIKHSGADEGEDEKSATWAAQEDREEREGSGESLVLSLTGT